MFPAFRPDKALAIGDPEFLPWLEQLAKTANVDIQNLEQLFASASLAVTTIFIPWAAVSPITD